MNRNFDYSELTDEQLCEMAVSLGIDVETLHAVHDHDFRGALENVTAKLRFDMFLSGELQLRTVLRDAPDRPEPKVSEIVSLLPQAVNNGRFGLGKETFSVDLYR